METIVHGGIKAITKGLLACGSLAIQLFFLIYFYTEARYPADRKSQQGADLANPTIYIGHEKPNRLCWPRWDFLMIFNHKQ